MHLVRSPNKRFSSLVYKFWRHISLLVLYLYFHFFYLLDHLLLIFILSRSSFCRDINDKCILCKNCDNSQEHAINDCAKTEKLWKKLTKELNDLDNETKNKTLLDYIFYCYYSKDLLLHTNYIFYNLIF